MRAAASRFLGRLGHRSLAFAAIGGLVYACHTPDPYSDDVPTKGHILILADEDLRSVVEAEEYVFESIYTKAELDIRYLPEAELLKAVMNDSVRCWIASVKPGAEQEKYYAKRSIKAHVVPVATEAIAVVGAREVRYQDVSTNALRDLLSAERDKSSLPKWAKEQTTELVANALFAGKGSGCARSIVDSLFHGDASNFSGQALPNMDSVLNRLALDPASIALLPFSAMSDLDNPAHKTIRDRVQLLPVSAVEGSAPVTPSQSTLADGSYPLRRPIYMVLCEGKSGLGTGFVSFVANHKGQRILLKQGIAPNAVPPRNVEVVTQ